ncbi:MAG: sigma-54-dependent Fis family transcriptional regulator [Deltaproteobacteria bacterium]|nr:sigma-54-dependent Fis family transcriptional regulator [Deltaproteobacteria bacterium]
MAACRTAARAPACKYAIRRSSAILEITGFRERLRDVVMTNETSWAPVEAALWQIIEALGVPSAMLAVLDRDQQRLDTIGAIGFAPRPQSELDEASTARIGAWLDAGLPSRGSSPVARDLGVRDDTDRLVAPIAGRGVLVLGRALHVSDAQLARAIAPLTPLVLRDATPIADPIVGADAGLRDVMRAVEQVAPTFAPVLLLGETGSGKEVVARAIHDRSPRRAGPILRVNCGAIAPELIDSELFGHERGSFTGASGQRRGWFERADGGTLFLDEIGELPLAAQVRLLRVLQDGEIQRVGGERPLRIDVRVIAATHRDLAAMVRAGQFREDLWYRIDVFAIRLPPLRERRADIALLAEHFAERAAQRFGSARLRLSPGDLALLEAHDWPGNVRELAAVIERAAILGEGRHLEIGRAIGVRREPAPRTIEFPSLDDAIRTHIERALKHCQGRIDGVHGAARLLQVHPNTLRSRMHKLGVRWDEFR